MPRCCRCHKDFEPPDGWHWKTCPPCAGYHRAYRAEFEVRDVAKCVRCKQPYSPSRKNQKRCDKCIAYYQAYYAANKERELARHAEWAARNSEHLRTYTARRPKQPDKRKRDRHVRNAGQSARYRSCGWKNHLYATYGLTQDAYAQMLAHQSGLCAICGDQLTKPHVDHCHATNTVRAILCRGCNFGLGAFRDNADHLAKAIEYLQSYRHDA